MRREILDKRHYFQLLKSFKLFRSYLCALLLLPLFAEAQQERGLTRDGNKFFDKGKFADAEAQYKKALEKKNNFPEAVFNLGDALYKQQRYDEAAKQFELSAKLLTDP